MSKKFIDLANLKSNLENFLSEIISPTFATKEGVSKQLGNHTVKSDVPENAVFTDTKDWESITGKPDSFPPSSHGHTISEITELQDTLDDKASSDHIHDDRYYTETEVDTKLNKKAEVIHTHTKSQITDIPTSMPANGGNADTVNSHTVKSDVPENAVFTDTVYDDTEVQKRISDNGYGEVAGGKNLIGIPDTTYTETLTDTIWSGVLTFPVELKSGTYSLSFLSDKSYTTRLQLKTDSWNNFGDILKESKDNEYLYKKSFVLDNDTTGQLYVQMKLNTGDTVNCYNIQIEEGSVATEYEPYFPSNKMLAEENTQQSTEMMDIKMLGWSVPKECPIQNEVNGNQFIQKVGRVEVGHLNFLRSLDEGFYVPEFKAINYGIATNHNNYFLDYPNYDTIVPLRTSTKGIFINVSSFNIKNESYKDISSFKTAMQGQYLYYELATYNTMTIDGNEIGETVSDVRKETTVNLLKPTLQTTNVNGITCTNNGDGTYTLNGTSTANTTFSLTLYNEIKGKFKVVGCPKNGSNTTYNILEIISNKLTGEWKSYKEEYGSGIIFENYDDNYVFSIDMRVAEGATVNNLVFKPMLTTNLDATYDDFVPYTGDTGSLNGDVADIRKSNKKLTEEITDIKHEQILNILSIEPKTLTSNGITCRIGYDGICYLSGTATTDTTFKLWKSYFDGIEFQSTKFKLVGAPNGASESTFCLQLTNEGAENTIIGSDYGDGFTFMPSKDIVLPQPDPDAPPNIKPSYVSIFVKSGQTLNSVKFKPMVTTSLDATYDDFCSYTGDYLKLNKCVSYAVTTANKVNNLTYNTVYRSSVDSGILTLYYLDASTLKGTHKLSNNFVKTAVVSLVNDTNLSDKNISFLASSVKDNILTVQATGTNFTESSSVKVAYFAIEQY